MNTYLALHLATIVPVLILGPFIIFRKHGDRWHVIVGRVWAYLMIASCLLSFGVLRGGHLSWLHGLSVFTLYSVVKAIFAIRKKDIKAHQRAMVGSYLGALVAFVFAATDPDRLIGTIIRKLISK
jgi:uncharacterized membrane protein